MAWLSVGTSNEDLWYFFLSLYLFISCLFIYLPSVHSPHFPSCLLLATYIIFIIYHPSTLLLFHPTSFLLLFLLPSFFLSLPLIVFSNSLYLHFLSLFSFFFSDKLAGHGVLHSGSIMNAFRHTDRGDFVQQTKR